MSRRSSRRTTAAAADDSQGGTAALSDAELAATQLLAVGAVGAATQDDEPASMLVAAAQAAARTGAVPSNSGEEEEPEPVPKRRKNSSAKPSEHQGPSEFVGVSWHKEKRKWGAKIRHDGKQQYLGRFDDEREAAWAVDAAARRLRGEDAHGTLSVVSGSHGPWLRLNFPTEEEAKRAKDRGALLTQADRAAAAAASERQGPSGFLGVCWHKEKRKWRAQIRHKGKNQGLGYFDDEREAARAVDTAARRLRGEGAHGGRAGHQWLRLNFPSKREARRAQSLGMPAAR
jgi:hypothetical protein